MTALPYELALELKEAGWPQPEFHSEEFWVYDPNRGDDFGMEAVAYGPSLDELIEACPRSISDKVSGRLLFSLMPASEGEGWHAEYVTENYYPRHLAEGLTRVEAVARLWLALKKDGKL
jgi:hypothetical protein